MNSKISRQRLGVKPVDVRWDIVRGDTASIRVNFLQLDEKTHYDISSWIFEAAAYSRKENIFDDLEVRVDGNDVVITANSDLTEFWGSGISKTVAELQFDLQVIIDPFTIWTPVIGTITVIGDVTGGRL